jgi:hypothetical protein
MAFLRVAESLRLLLRTPKSIAAPFQEGYVLAAGRKVHVFTDYLWNDGTVLRRWLMDSDLVDLSSVVIRPFDIGRIDIQ